MFTPQTLLSDYLGRGGGRGRGLVRGTWTHRVNFFPFSNVSFKRIVQNNGISAHGYVSKRNSIS